MTQKTYTLITGASSGLGSEFAKQLAAKGHNLIITARRVERLENLAKELREKNKIEVVTCFSDLAQVNGALDLFNQSIQENRIITGLVNNAGQGHYGNFSDYALDKQSMTMQLNMTSLVELTYLVVQHMKKHQINSFILNVGSLAAFIPIPMFSVYAGTKAFVRFFSEALNYELKDTNILVSAIHPGGTMTEFMEHANQIVSKNASRGMMTAEAVVKISLNVIETRKSESVTGILNKLIAFMPKILPMKWAMRISYSVMSKMVTVSHSQKGNS